MKHDDWDWSDPRTLLGVPSPPLSGSRPLLAVSGSSRGWPARVSSSHTWETRIEWTQTSETPEGLSVTFRVQGLGLFPLFCFFSFFTSIAA